MEAAPREMSQADFAREMGVSRAAVSQWKSKDILRDDAFTKPGKTGKVIFHIAVEQVRRNRDIGQSLGNGIATRTTVESAPQAVAAPEPGPAPVQQPALPMLEAVPPEPAPQVAGPTPPAPTLPKADTVEDQLKRAKLEQQLRTNRIQASEEALRQGMLVDAEDAREQMTRIAGMMMQIFEGALTDFAAALASQFDVPQRDALHLLRNEFRNVRKTATMKQRTLSEANSKEATATVDVDA